MAERYTVERFRSNGTVSRLDYNGALAIALKRADYDAHVGFCGDGDMVTVYGPLGRGRTVLVQYVSGSLVTEQGA